jgi:hypothetical protein
MIEDIRKKTLFLVSKWHQLLDFTQESCELPAVNAARGHSLLCDAAARIQRYASFSGALRRLSLISALTLPFQLGVAHANHAASSPISRRNDLRLDRHVCLTGGNSK